MLNFLTTFSRRSTKKMDCLADKSVWYSFIEGNVQAYSAIFRNFYPGLHNYGLKISGNETLTEDCLQDFFVYLYDNRENLGEIKSIKSYLFVSFRRALLKSLKKERAFTSEIPEQAQLENFEFSPEEIAIKQEFTAIKTATLTTILNTLSKKERESIYLKYYSDLKVSEIAIVMDITYQSVLNNIQRAFSKIRKELENKAVQEIFLSN
ncbi:RNA polymerase sigma factor [Spongiivirga citrea]|uniref:Sigma-70 family RNA polymerase sigma factor n=1 Tax=Spongiivirga citrea TaxID=1481457 RepID=A0A6M0CIF7_9FLAO|nr:sigma-70 family RNA polymerase sigma factor [Spongiivirga citrea]NER16733.1 sigma-70 family RNA polymerase sigma factor [Spongiivirga citrea]